MKILLFSGTHSRHLFLHKKIINSGNECRSIIMEREKIIPKLNNESTKVQSIDRDNYKFHFDERYRVEKEFYGELDFKEVFSEMKSLYCTKDELNSSKSIEFIKEFNPDISIVFGSGIISKLLIDLLPNDTINVHLGLSPMYKGSATLFWPFYNLEPQFAGVTFHKITAKVDAGDILHQSVPKMEYGDGIHELSAKAVVKASDELINLIERKKSKGWEYVKQRNSGKLYLTSDFKPHHLRVIYNLFNNNIVDEYLDKKLSMTEPELVKINFK